MVKNVLNDHLVLVWCYDDVIA